MIRYLLLIVVSFVVFSCGKKIINSDATGPKYAAPVNTIEEKAPQPKPVEPVIVNKKYQREPITETIYFEFDSDSPLNIGTLSNFCNKPGIISITGGACPIGEDQYNFGLGLRRALNVKVAMENMGIKNISHLRSVGETNLVTVDEPEYWRNRRVEVTLK